MVEQAREASRIETPNAMRVSIRVPQAALLDHR
jgi:hypothetical protein